MFKRLVISVIVAALLLVGAVAVAQESGEQAPASVCFGGRLQHDMTFYLQGGVAWEKYDLMAALGFNNAIWLGGHVLLVPGDTITGFAGVELHVEYPDGKALELHPALAVGLSFNEDPASCVIEALLQPVPEGKPIQVLFAVSFLFEL